MGRLKTLNSAKSNHVEDEKQQMKPSNSPIVLSSDDDEANEDLSLKIVERAKLRSCTTSRNAAVLYESKRSGGGGSVDVIDVSLSPSLESEVVTDVKDNKTKKKEKKKKKNKMIETQDDTVDVAKEAEKKGICKSIEVDKSVERNAVEISDNTVLRKLLRGPRYFDPPDSGWGTCYNCGEEGHTTVNCTSARRKKPCFVCGSLDHNAKQCKKGQDCFICKKRGHRAKDCPEKYTQSQSAKICLKCGHSGHEMFTCKNDYSPEDLKEIQCYMCKSFGHLSCVNYTGTVPRDVSCYKCGQSGHTGLACMGLRGETNDTGSLSSCYRCGEEGHFARECTSSTKAYTGMRGETNDTGSPSSCYRCGDGGHFARECTSSVKAYTGLRGETNDTGSPSSCYRCGEGGHFARECTSSVKSAKRNREVSTPTRRYTKDNRDWLEARSAPHDFGKARKRKKNQYDEGSTTSSKSKHRGGWITEDPEDLPRRKAKANGWGSTATPKQRGGWITEDPGDLPRRKGKANGWGSPSTPTYKNNKIYDSSYGGHASNSRCRIGQNRHYENTFSNGSANFYQQRYSASRFNNYSSDGTRRNYDW